MLDSFTKLDSDHLAVAFVIIFVLLVCVTIVFCRLLDTVETIFRKYPLSVPPTQPESPAQPVLETRGHLRGNYSEEGK